MEKNAVGKGVEGHIGTGIVTHTHTHTKNNMYTLCTYHTFIVYQFVAYDTAAQMAL